MTAQPVEAVWAWKFSTSVFQATYGRVPQSTLFSKDFLQASGESASGLERLVCQGSSVQPTPVRFVWPQGSRPGQVLRAADYANNGRLLVKWPTNDAPDPWRLATAPGSGTVETIPGTPGQLTSDAAAVAVWTQLQQQCLEPWILAVKLADGTSDLHVRSHLGAPPPGMEHASTSRLPAAVQTLLGSISRGSGVLEPGRRSLPRAGAIVERILDALKTGPNVLLVGPPGTGKTVALEDLRELYAIRPNCTMPGRNPLAPQQGPFVPSSSTRATPTRT